MEARRKGLILAAYESAIVQEAMRRSHADSPSLTPTLLPKDFGAPRGTVLDSMSVLLHTSASQLNNDGPAVASLGDSRGEKPSSRRWR